MECPHNTKIKNPKTGKEMYVPCKKCVVCKINITQAWTIRLLMEKATTDDCVFLTLTYDDEHLPLNGTLQPDDLKQFWKNLRQLLPDRKIKYYACGEYGENTKRPHYHAIVFGINSSFEVRKAIFESWKKCDRFQWFGKTWNKVCGTVTADSCSYVAGYVQKKLFGDMAKEEYESKGLYPPFSRSSQRLGDDYFLKHKDEICEAGYINYKGHKAPIPDYFKKKYAEIIDNTESVNAYQLRRREEYQALFHNIDMKGFGEFYEKNGFTLYDFYKNIDRSNINDELIKKIKARNNLRSKKI